MGTERRFAMQDQEWFAALTGDTNPMHMDAVAARRTPAGAPVVHGIHSALWCLDSVAKTLGNCAPVASLRVNFDSFITTDETVEANLLKSSSDRFRAQITAGGTPVVALAVGFGEPRATVSMPTEDGEPFDSFEPVELALEEMAGRGGRVKLATSVAVIGDAFPHAARLLGPVRVAGLGALTRLVGMVCPGLHSVFHSLSVRACTPTDAFDTSVSYRVSRFDPRYRRLVHDVTGCGWTGTITCSARHPPTPQPSMETLSAEVAPDAFHGQTALIIGGSRGLGELTAKLIAAGGGRVVVTYSTGRADAEALVQSINAAGGAVSAFRYNVLEDPGPQLTGLAEKPTHIYYFATPTITGRRNTRFNHQRFARFTDFYVMGFARLLEALSARLPEGVRVLYPSSVAVAERPAGMTEYAMAKAAGEVFCTDIGMFHPSARITTLRLPRLPTDQTATLQSVETADPVAVLLPELRALHAD